MALFDLFYIFIATKYCFGFNQAHAMQHYTYIASSLFAFYRTALLFLALAVFACQHPRTPEGFQIEPGFKLERVAAEPLIKDPVDLEFNERGEAMVLEMPGYPFEDRQSRLLVLQDKNKDGTYDESSVFAEGLQLANSFLPYKKGVLVAAPPYLLFLHDDDQNNVADQVDTLMGGFSTGNLQHNYNGLTYGLDDWIYAANGGNDGKPYWWGDPESALDLRGQDFRINLETRTLERLGESSGGFGLGMDEYGRLYETHNLTHISTLVFPSRYFKGKDHLEKSTLENASNHEENGLARIYPIGEQESRVNHPEQSGYFSGSCGITYYGGGAFGEEYDHTVWVADVVLNLVHVDKIKAQGASFTAQRQLDQRDFLASNDRAFRPVNMNVGPDGSMYLVDMYRKVIEHPEWIPDDIEKTLDLEAGKDQGRIYRISKGTARAFDVTQFKTETGLVQALTHANQWVRKTAHRLLMEQKLGQTSLQGLKGLLKDKNPLAKVHALHILAAQGELSDKELAAVLADQEAPIRETALQLAESKLGNDPTLLQTCIQLLNDPDQRVRMQAALSLSTLDEASAVYQKQRTAILAGLNAAAQKSMDTWNTCAIALAAQGSAADLFASLIQSKQPAKSDLLTVLAQSAAQSTQGLQGVLQQLAAPKTSNATRQNILQQLSQEVPELSGTKTLEPALKALEQSRDLGLISASAALRQRLNLPPSPEFLTLSRSALQKVNDATLPDSTRVQQLALLTLLPYAQKSKVLFACLPNNQPIQLQEEALRQLANYAEPEIGQRLVQLWAELGPHIRKYAGDLLLDREIYHDALLTGLEKGQINIGEMNFDLERRRTLLWWTDNESTKRRAEKLFSDAAVVTRQAAIDKMKPALTLKGTVAKGKMVFETNCANCHRYGNTGVEVGPVLTEISRKSKATLLHDILDPNAAADPKYISHRLESKDGLSHLGIVAAETDHSVTLLKMGGEKVTLAKKELKSFRSMGTSLMMEGFENAISVAEMGDLLAFLQGGE